MPGSWPHAGCFPAGHSRHGPLSPQIRQQRHPACRAARVVQPPPDANDQQWWQHPIRPPDARGRGAMHRRGHTPGIKRPAPIGAAQQGQHQQVGLIDHPPTGPWRETGYRQQGWQHKPKIDGTPHGPDQGRRQQGQGQHGRDRVLRRRIQAQAGAWQSEQGHTSPACNTTATFPRWEQRHALRLPLPPSHGRVWA